MSLFKEILSVDQSILEERTGEGFVHMGIQWNLFITDTLVQDGLSVWEVGSRMHL